MSKFISNVITLFSATLLGQILGIIVSPVLSRLYSPADFGIYQLFFSISGLISIGACLSYNGAINLPKKDEDGAYIVILCLILTIITAGISVVLMVLFSKSIENLLNAPGLSSYLFLVPMAVIASVTATIFYAWLSRKKHFGTIAQANLSSSILGKTTSVGLGFLSPSPFGLIFGSIINDAIIMLVSLRKILNDSDLFQRVTFERIREMSIRYKNFPRFSTGASLMSAAAVECIPFMLAFSFSPVVVGLYGMTYIIITLPLKLMGNSLSTVFYQKACEEKNRTGSIVHVMKSVHTRLISLGMFICLILMIIGPELFTFVLGEQWRDAGIYGQILAPWMFFVFISTPLSSIFNVFGKQGANLGFTILLLLSRIMAILVGGYFGDPVICMILLSVTGVFFWSWMNLFLLKMAEVSARDAIFDLLRFLSLGIIVSFPVLIAKFLSFSSLLLFAIALAVSIVYYLIIVYQDPQLKEGLTHFLANIVPK